MKPSERMRELRLKRRSEVEPKPTMEELEQEQMAKRKADALRRRPKRRKR